MHQAVLALGWEMVARHRILFALAAGYLATIAVVVPVLPPEWRSMELPGFLLVPFYAVFPFVILVLVQSEGKRFETTRSHFPVRLFLLPVPTWVLAGTPLLLGSLVMLVWWLTVARWILWPCGVEVPLLWPGLLLAACLVWIQALSWSPFPLPWVRIFLVCAVLIAFWMVGWTLIAAGVDGWGVHAVMAVKLAAGYTLAFWGVSRGRRGVGFADEVLTAPVEDMSQEYPPFSSPFRALLWREYRMQRWGVVAGVGTGVACAVAGMHMAWLALHQEHLVQMSPWLQFVVAHLGPAWVAIGYVFLVPWLWSLLGGGDLGRMSDGTGGHAISSFLATLPVSTRDVVAAKVVMAGATVLFSWTVSLLATLLWAIAVGQIGPMATRLVEVAGSPTAAILTLAGILAALVFISWLWTVQALWTGLSGRPGLLLIPAALGLLFCAALVLGPLRWNERWYPVLVAGVVIWLAARLITVVALVVRLRRQRLLSPGELGVLLGAWTVLAAVLAAAAWRWLPGGVLAAGVMVVVLPLARCLAAPVALAWNRHR